MGKTASKSRASFDDRKEEIYAKAAALFAQNGYLNTNMTTVAKAVNLEKGGLYHYIENKETLLFEILDRALNAFLEGAKALPLEGLPPEKKLELLLHQYTTTLVHYLSEVVILAFAGRYLRPELQKLIDDKRLRYEHYFHSIISEGLSNKTFIEHADKETLSFLVIGAVFNYYLWNPTELKGNLEEKIKGFTAFFLNGLLKR
jgi:AcrR family transcriptional regulator